MKPGSVFEEIVDRAPAIDFVYAGQVQPRRVRADLAQNAGVAAAVNRHDGAIDCDEMRELVPVHGQDHPAQGLLKMEWECVPKAHDVAGSASARSPADMC